MTLSFLYRAFCRILQLVRLIGRRNVDLAVEIVMLRHEVALLRRQVHRPMLQPADRAVLAGLTRLLPHRRLGCIFVQPATLLRWHRDLIAKHWTYPRGRPGRRRMPKGTTALVIRLAMENPDWGYRRIHGKLTTMGIAIAPSSVWAILKRHGIEPSPRRSGPSLMGLYFAKGTAACMGVGWEERGRHLLGQFRGAAAEHPLDPRFAELVEALRNESPKFAAWWLDNRVENALTGQIAVRRPPVGIIRLDVSELTVAAQPSLTLCVQVPRRPSDKSKLAQIV